MTTPPQHLTDEQLMAQVQAGQRQALTGLYDRYSRIVYGMALQKLADPAEAEDVVHDVFVNLWRRGGTFHPERGNLRSWLLTVAHSEIVDQLRQRRRTADVQDAIHLDLGFAANPSVEGLEAVLERYAGVQQVRRALQALPQDQREVVVRSYYQGHTLSQISNALRLPLDTVKSRMRQALTGLRTELGPDGNGL